MLHKKFHSKKGKRRVLRLFSFILDKKYYKKGDKVMTNREKLENMTNEEFGEKIKELGQLQALDYVDWKKWCDSENEEIPYLGIPGHYAPFDKKFAICDDKPCVIVGEQKIKDVNYKILVDDDHVVICPEDRVYEETA